MADRTTVTRATESTDSPTPGYLYNDIAKSVSASPLACSETANYLVRRLGSKGNHNIKYKCLKVMQMVAISPLTRGQFKRALCQDVTAIATIKQCLNFRGPPDAVHGDQIYVKVRQQAKETLDAIYSDSPSSEQSGSSGMVGMSGFGSGSFGGTGVGVNSTNLSHPASNLVSRKMEGIGNPMFKDPRRAEGEKDIGEMTVGEIVSAAKEGFAGIIKDPLARNATRGNIEANTNRHRISQWNSTPPGASQLAHATGGEWTMASNRGANAFGKDHHCDAYHNSGSSSGISSGVGGSWASVPASVPSVVPQACVTMEARSLPPTGNVVKISGPTGVAASDGNYERNLIHELCPPGGMRAEPPPDKLKSFEQAIPSLNPDLVCPALLDALEDGQPWIIRAKALCVMETSILIAEENRKNKREGGNNAYADFFHACREEIQPLATHTRSAVRDPAKRVLKALGVEVEAHQKVSVRKGSQIAVQTVAPPNLLDFDDVTRKADSLLHNISPPVELPSVPPEIGTSNSASSSDLRSEGNSLFGGMNMKNDIDKTEVPVTPASELVKDTETDLLDATEDAKLDTTAGFLGSLSVKGKLDGEAGDGKENIAVETKSEEPTGSTSGFTFMNSTEKSEVSANSPTANKDTFDPLLSPETRNLDQKNVMQQPMQINPQTAAAYQQQILMMRMQMQQMQMANSSTPFMMMQQAQKQGASGSLKKGSPMIKVITGKTTPVMGATNGSGVATSFAFMEDPAKVKREASNKKFDFVQDAMKDAK